jgi:hypothetical protein
MEAGRGQPSSVYNITPSLFTIEGTEEDCVNCPPMEAGRGQPSSVCNITALLFTIGGTE